MNLTEEEIKDLKTVVDHFEKEDQATRDRQIRSWRRLKFLWDGFTRTWYSETAHDWRVYDNEQSNDDGSQDYYNKPINIFRAYLESIIAALSVVVPPIKCFPDDAENPLDILTAKSGDKIGELISRHNDVSLLWIHALFTYCTEGMVACYNYTKEDKEYGTYKKKNFKDEEQEIITKSCPDCGSNTGPTPFVDESDDEYDPSGDFCSQCMKDVPEPTETKSNVIVTRFVGETDEPKSRQCMEIYGGLYIKVANYAKKQKDTPYLIFSYETNFTIARDRYQDIRDKIKPGMGNPGEPYARWGRNNPQYYGEMPTDTVTVRNTWLRPCAFEVLDEENCDNLKKKFPDGCKVVFVEQEFAEACNESLDDHWTLTHNPLSDYLYFDPIGLLLTSVQEITNDLVSLTLQTIEHGIPQTFADPNFLNFKAYSQMEVTPGGIYPSKPIIGGRSIKDGFYEVKTATLSQEILPFTAKIQEYGQLVSGAQPSIFGGAVGGSGTASEYSMQRAQSLQRLQTTWKMFTIWWKNIYGKVIPAYIKEIKDDERLVERNNLGGFVNVLIRKAELEGKIGRIEIEANENLPMTWNQRRDVIMKLMEANNPQILSLIAQPENLELIYEAIGITDFYVPGEDDRIKQFDEIQQLLNSEPIEQPPDPNLVEQAVMSGQPEPQPTELPSVEIDQDMDNHQIEFEICRKWAISESGQLAKIENKAGYRNVLLHASAHKQMLQPPPPQPPAPKISYSFAGPDLIDPQIRQILDRVEQLPSPDNSGEQAPLGNTTQDKNAPIKGDSNVPVQA